MRGDSETEETIRMDAAIGIVRVWMAVLKCDRDMLKILRLQGRKAMKTAAQVLRRIGVLRSLKYECD